MLRTKALKPRAMTRRTMLAFGLTLGLSTWVPYSSAVADQSPNKSTLFNELFDMDWRFIQSDGLLSDYRIRLRSNGLVSGHDGCNSFAGQYSIEAERLVFSSLRSTKRACGRNKPKGHSSKVFMKMKRFERQGNLLLLFGENDHLLAKLEGTPVQK